MTGKPEIDRPPIRRRFNVRVADDSGVNDDKGACRDSFHSASDRFRV